MMNRLPAKQIYLLSIIIIGIITLSVYSTYAIYTLEGETSDIVSMNTSNYLNIETSTYEYSKITVQANSTISTDIDVYNNYDYDLCYSVWYKIVQSKNISAAKVSIYQNTNEGLTTSGTIAPVSSRRINIIIKNNNENPVKINIGIAYSKNEGTCELNISTDKYLISSTVDETKTLDEIIMKNDEIKNNDSNYITYQNQTKEIILQEDKLTISNKYDYKDEIFTLTDSKEVDIDTINTNQIIYTCINDTKCRHLYRITEIKKENDIYKITKYDEMIGYLSGTSGVRKVNQNYYYYGDNPNNFIYYNCTDELDTKTCELWRIIGVFYDSKEDKYIPKIIKNDSLDIIEYSNTDNVWNNSSIKNKLKDIKIENETIKTEITNKIESVNNKLEITELNETFNSSIMLMNLSDYINTSICENKKITEFDEKCLNNNWLNKNYNNDEWTMTIRYDEPYIDEITSELVTPDNNMVYSIGSGIKTALVTTKLNIRPVVYLKDTTVLLDGNGTYEKPFMVG